VPDEQWVTMEERAHETVFAVDVEFAPGDCARAGWMMELAADRVMAIVPG
jgi:hypothetical protein